MDFIKEVLHSAETPDRVLAGKISYSAARHQLFEFCPRACFFRYYGAQGGWDPYAGEFARKVFRLKYMRTLEGEGARILSEALSRMLFHKEWEWEDAPSPGKEKEEEFLEKWKYFASKEVWKMGKFLEEEAWRKDPKMPDFLELHGDNPIFQAPRELLDFLIENLKEFFREAEEDSYLLPTLAGIGKEAWRSHLSFRDLTVENIPIILPPFLMLLHKGTVAKITFSFRFSGKEYKEDHDAGSYGENATLSDRIFGLFTERTFPGHTPEKWEIKFHKGRLLFHPAPITPLSIPFLLESAEKIFSLPEGAVTLSQEDFPCREKKEECRFCRYFSLCQK